jgi:hypothetical protein
MSIRIGLLSSGCHKAAEMPMKASFAGFGLVYNQTKNVVFTASNDKTNQLIGTNFDRPAFISHQIRNDRPQWIMRFLK